MVKHQNVKKKETALTSELINSRRQTKKSVRFIRPQRMMNMEITIPQECPVCGTQYNLKEYEECPHCEDNEFDPYSVFKDVDKDYQ